MIDKVYIDCYSSSRILIENLGLRERQPDLYIHEGDPDENTLEELATGARLILNGHTPMDRALLARCKRLEKIIFLGTGASTYVDPAAAKELGIKVESVRNYGDRTIAEHAFALILDAGRKICCMDRRMRQNLWEVHQGMELAGKQLGVIGVGGVGSELVRMASGFGMNVVGWNRSPIASELPCRSIGLRELMVTSDVISLHLALNKQTRGLIDYEAFRSMREGVIFINVARGELVDENAMLAALESGRIGHAGLDVFETEPLPLEHPLRCLDNVSLTAHAAFSSEESLSRLLTWAFDMAADGSGV